MQLAPLLPADLGLARELFRGGPITTLLPRPSSEPPAGGNEHAGHVANDPALFDQLGLALLGAEELPRDGLLALRMDEAPATGSPLCGVVSVRCAGEVGTLDCLALNVDIQSKAATLDAMVAGCVQYARAAGCMQLKLQGWVDDSIDERGPLAELKGSRRDTAADVLAALERAGFRPPTSGVGLEHELDVMMGRPLGEGSPPIELSALPAGYSAHAYRPDVDQGRWREAMLAIFPEPECADPYFTAENLYTRRRDYAKDEVVMIECEGADTAVGIGAGVAHSFGLNTSTGDIVPDSDTDGTAHDGEVAPQRIVYLDWIGLLPAHRGKRLGEYISVSCLRSLAERGESYCTLWTQPSRAAAIRLYRRLGFVQIARVVELSLDLTEAAVAAAAAAAAGTSGE